MFPLDFPLRVLSRRAQHSDWVLDPFAGRGTTPYAARMLGLGAIAIDTSPVAVAITEAKLAMTTPPAVTTVTERILSTADDVERPVSEFWQRAFAPRVLGKICQLRAALMSDCRSDSRKALRAIILGALHGPVNARTRSYFSNQSPRTYAPKPDYAVRFWSDRELQPPDVDVIEIIKTRAERFYRSQPPAKGFVIAGDSRERETFSAIHVSPRWVVTSPPYYGMKTYVPDQWLRNWFLGGPAHVDYVSGSQLEHGSPAIFAADLRKVWDNVAAVAAPGARMVVRFGGISDRAADPLEIIRQSFADSGWRITRTNPAGSADAGRRQALSFTTTKGSARAEYDLWVSQVD